MNRYRSWSAAALIPMCTTLLPHGAQAQTWPTQPVKIIVPFNPGGITDNLARILAKGLTETTGQTVIVENKPGAGGNLGSAFVAKSQPDGHTLLVSAPGNFSINQFIYKSMPYSPEKDLTGITVIGQTPMVLVVNPKLPVQTVKQLIDHAKSNPGKLNGSSGGNGTTSHLSLELFKMMAGVDIVHVPYNGSAPARTDLLGGQVQMSINDLGTFIGDIRSGSLRVLAAGTKEPSHFLPGVPTLAQSGLPDYSSTGWYALAAPSGTPKPIVEAISKAVIKVLKSPAVAKSIEAAGADVGAGTTSETNRFIAAEAAKWKKAVDTSGATIE
jgi:tripartite-type tricarboxylate transporter receptor subunit TctC